MNSKRSNSAPTVSATTSAWDNYASMSGLDIACASDSSMTTPFLTCGGECQIAITLSVYCYDQNHSPLQGLTPQDLADTLYPIYSSSPQGQVQKTDSASRGGTGNPLAYVWNGEGGLDTSGKYWITYLLSASPAANGLTPAIAACFAPPDAEANNTVGTDELIIDAMADAWYYCASVPSLTLAFSEYPDKADYTIPSTGEYQIAVTATVTCLDPSGRPLYQLLDDNLFGALELIYYDTGDKLICTDDVAPGTDGPLTYTRFPLTQSTSGADIASVANKKSVSNSDGTYSITYYISAPTTSTDTTSKIGASFTANGKTYTTRSGTPYDSFLTISNTSDPWWNLASVTDLSLAFTDYLSSTSRNIYADGGYQIAITTKVTCIDQNNNPLTGMTDDDVMHAIHLDYYDSGTELTRTDNVTPDTGGNPFTYATNPSNEYSPNTTVVSPPYVVADDQGTYSIIYYVSAPGTTTQSTNKIAAEFIANNLSYTTLSDSPYNSFLTISATNDPWWNLGSVTDKSIVFTDYSTTTTNATIYADGAYQVAITIKLTCSDQDNNPLTGMTDDDVLSATYLNYQNSRTELTRTDNVTPDTGGNPFTYATNPSSEYTPKPAEASPPHVVADDSGAYSITYYVSAPETSNGSQEAILATFIATGNSYTILGGSDENTPFNISASTDPWWNLASISALTIYFKDNASELETSLYANGLNQVAVTLSVTCLNQTGYPLTGIADDDVISALSLIYYDPTDDNTLQWAETISPSIVGNPLVYSATDAGYSTARFTVAARETAPTDDPGVYYLIYYVSVPPGGGSKDYEIAANFNANNITATTAHTADNTFDLGLVIHADPSKIYLQGDFSLDREDTWNGTCTFPGGWHGAGITDSFDQDTYHLYINTADYYMLHATATGGEAHPGNTNAIIFGIGDNQKAYLNNLVQFSYSYGQVPIKVSLGLYVYNQSGQDDFQDVLSSTVSMTIPLRTYAMAFIRMSASTNAIDYDHGDNWEGDLTVKVMDQYANTASVLCQESAGDCYEMKITVSS
ncbi:MAG TPA: hypothetical protein VGL08_09915 [Paraburkholderia sp.]